MNQPNRILIAVFGPVVVGVFTAAPAFGTDKYFCGDTDNTWNDDGNWKQFDPSAGGNCANGTDSTVPTAADRAIIVSGKTCNVDIETAEADSLNVESTATLNIQAAKKLTLDDDAGSNTTIAGTLSLQGASSELAFITNNQTINGGGTIAGQDNAAKITIVEFKTLTNDTTIKGHLEIGGDGDFVNSGTVNASAAGTLAITVGSIEDDSGALWKISGSSSAILKIAVSDPTLAVLDGDFEIFDNGRLDVDSEGFTTTGTLDWRGGKIDVASGSSVEFGTP